MTQRILTPDGHYRELDEALRDLGVTRLLLVCDGAWEHLDIRHWAEELRDVTVTFFRDFQPNPRYESVAAGVRCFREADAQAIFAAGGGSAMDVAKCIKLFCRMDAGRNYLDQPIVPNDVPLIAMPTTAGTGSEATRYAVIYRDGEKQSVTHDSIVPSVVLMDPSALRMLPPYQRKATMLDALCHAVESCWSVHSTDESRTYAREAISLVTAHMPGYLANAEEGNAGMLRAANTAGKAINITQTTAGHAMCYKLTCLYGLAHGHAAALCNRALFPWMLAHPERCTDPRGSEQLRSALADIASAMGCGSAEQAADKLDRLVRDLGLSVPSPAPEDFDTLVRSVNPVRLKNFPMRLGEEDITALYHRILRA